MTEKTSGAQATPKTKPEPTEVFPLYGQTQAPEIPGRSYICSFCGRDHSHPEVKRLIAGAAGVYICGLCVERSVGVLVRELT